MAVEVMQRGLEEESLRGVNGFVELSSSSQRFEPSSSNGSRNHARRVTHPAAKSPIPFPLTHIPEARSNTSQHLQSAQHTFPSLPPKSQLVGTQMSSPRQVLPRRRSSFPPETPPSATTKDSTCIAGGTPGMQVVDVVRFEDFVGLGDHLNAIGGTGWTPDDGGWEGLLDFGADTKQDDAAPPFLFDDILSSTPTVMSRSHSDPAGDSRQGLNTHASPSGAASTSFSPGRVAQYGSDLAWKTILSSVVEVEGVGETSVVRVLQEIWKRGGGDSVTAQCLWPSIIIALSNPLGSGADIRIPTPSSQGAQALRELYNLTLRHWEPSIFSGLLASYASTSQTSPPDLSGASTPARIADISQFMITPAPAPAHLESTGFIPRSISNAYDFRFDPDVRRSSIVRTEWEEQARGINEILAEMEEGKEAHERAVVHASLDSLPGDAYGKAKRKSRSEEYQFPTSETDSSKSPSTKRHSMSRIDSSRSPDSMDSPFVTASSATASIVSKIVPTTTRQPPPTSLMMPNTSFVPPPPMCMFFSPAFKDLQKGKVGVWKGDLELRGRGGGKFSILIVGEESTGHLWQSNAWPSTIAHPSDNTPVDPQGSCTSSMIPVSHLARDGFTPIAMGMVLCNDADVNPYVHMVQGLHAEGVAFHLPNPARLPLVFLPAKFNATDPLQRLGIAFMSRPTVQAPLSDPSSEKSAPKRKRRRQSAPAKPISGGGQHKTESLAGSKGVILEEEIVVE